MKAPSGRPFPFGPQGTGKSTWVAAQSPKALRVDLEARSARLQADFGNRAADCHWFGIANLVVLGVALIAAPFTVFRLRKAQRAK